MSVSTQNNWWVDRQMQRTYRLECLLNHIFSIVLFYFVTALGKFVNVSNLSFRRRMQMKSHVYG